MLDTDTIHTCKCFQPVRNLYTNYGQIRKPEAEFSDRFAAAYQRNFCGIHRGTTRQQTLFVREVPVQGNGIADLVALNWRHVTALSAESGPDLTQAKPIVRAFEVKLSDWRGGLMQAHRYKYFSHAAILVVPKKKLDTIKNHLDLFLTLRVGLWGFDPGSDAIVRVYTPRPRRPQIEKYSRRVLSVASNAALT